MSPKKKDSKKVKVVFEKPEDIKNSGKVSQSSKNKKVSNKKSKETKIEHSKKEHNESSKKEHSITPVKKRKNVFKKSKKRDLWIIGILALLIVGIVLASFLIPQDTLKDDSTNDSNTDSLDENISSEDYSYVTQEYFEQEYAKLNLKIIEDVLNYQKDILENHYDELGLVEEEMETCFANNDYIYDDALESEILISIINNVMLAQELNVVTTPTVYANGYYLSGFKHTEPFIEFIESIKDVESLSLDYNNNSFTYDDSELKLYVIQDNENENIVQENNEFRSFLQDSNVLVEDVRNIFTEIFNVENTTVLDYRSSEAIEIMETIDANVLPVYYLVGDTSSLNSLQDDSKETFELIFEKEEINNGYKMYPQILRELVTMDTFDGVFKVLDYENLFSNEHTFGDLNASLNLILFTDYESEDASLFMQETIDDDFFTNYISSGEANLKIIPMLTDDFSMFPILFFKCAEKQNSSLEAHNKIFELQNDLNYSNFEDVIYEKYEEEINKLSKEYEYLASQTQEN